MEHSIGYRLVDYVKIRFSGNKSILHYFSINLIFSKYVSRCIELKYL